MRSVSAKATGKNVFHNISASLPYREERKNRRRIMSKKFLSRILSLALAILMAFSMIQPLTAHGLHHGVTEKKGLLSRLLTRLCKIGEPTMVPSPTAISVQTSSPCAPCCAFLFVCTMCLRRRFSALLPGMPSAWTKRARTIVPALPTVRCISKQSSGVPTERLINKERAYAKLLSGY